jgi:hypothetical protein
MGDIMRDLTAIATALIGLAIVAVLVRSGSQTVGIISAASSGFATTLSAAMGDRSY